MINNRHFPDVGKGPILGRGPSGWPEMVSGLVRGRFFGAAPQSFFLKMPQLRLEGGKFAQDRLFATGSPLRRGGLTCTRTSQ